MINAAERIGTLLTARVRYLMQTACDLEVHLLNHYEPTCP
jgi:hypothetical protein